MMFYGGFGCGCDVLASFVKFIIDTWRVGVDPRFQCDLNHLVRFPHETFPIMKRDSRCRTQKQTHLYIFIKCSTNQTTKILNLGLASRMCMACYTSNFERQSNKSSWGTRLCWDPEIYCLDLNPRGSQGRKVTGITPCVENEIKYKQWRVFVETCTKCHKKHQGPWKKWMSYNVPLQEFRNPCFFLCWSYVFFLIGNARRFLRPSPIDSSTWHHLMTQPLGQTS